MDLLPDTFKRELIIDARENGQLEGKLGGGVVAELGREKGGGEKMGGEGG